MKHINKSTVLVTFVSIIVVSAITIAISNKSKKVSLDEEPKVAISENNQSTNVNNSISQDDSNKIIEDFEKKALLGEEETLEISIDENANAVLEIADGDQDTIVGIDFIEATDATVEIETSSANSNLIDKATKKNNQRNSVVVDESDEAVAESTEEYLAESNAETKENPLDQSEEVVKNAPIPIPATFESYNSLSSSELVALYDEYGADAFNDWYGEVIKDRQNRYNQSDRDYSSEDEEIEVGGETKASD